MKSVRKSGERPYDKADAHFQQLKSKRLDLSKFLTASPPFKSL